MTKSFAVCLIVFLFNLTVTLLAILPDGVATRDVATFGVVSYIHIILTFVVFHSGLSGSKQLG